MSNINHLNRPAPAQTLLDGEWAIAFDPENRGKAEGWQSLTEPPADAQAIAVPSCWEETNPGYDGAAWYWRAFEAPPAAEQERLFLVFDAVNYHAEVWLNGQHVGASEGGYTPFSLDVTEACAADGANTLTVRVLCPPKDEVGIDGFILKELPSWRTFESFNFGGIWQSVRLLRLPRMHMRDCFARPSAGLDGVEVELELPGEPTCDELTVRVEVRERDATGLVVGEATPSFPEAAFVTRLTFPLSIANPKHWSPEEPNLYLLRASVEAGSRRDVGEVTFGLRALTLSDNRFCLNGEPYFIKGGFHEGLYPVGLPRPPSREFVVDELQKAKDAGFNLLRYWQIPIHPTVIDVADELGIMLMNEPPIEWMTQTDETAERCRSEVARLVRRDRNHPSVVFWTILNETGIQPDFNRRNAVSASAREWQEAPVQRVRDELCQLARSLDPTRLIIDDSGGFMSHANIYLPGESRKQPFNDLHTYQRVPIPEQRLHELRELGSRPGRLSAAEVQPGIAVLLSEFGYGSFPDFEAILERYREASATHTEDYAHHEALCESLREGFDKHGMCRFFDSVADLCRECQRVHGEGNALQTMALRANPLVGGYVMHAFSAGGCILGAELFDTWRQPKLVADAVREMQRPHILAALFEHAAVSTGEPLHADLFSVRDAGGPSNGALEARVTIGSPSGEERTVPLGPAALTERVDTIWSGTIDLGTEAGAYSLRFELVGADGSSIADVTRPACVVADTGCDVTGPVACIGGDHLAPSEELQRCGVPVTHNAAAAPLVLAVPHERARLVAEGYRQLLSAGKTVITVVPGPGQIQWVLDAFGIEGDVRTGVGNWSPVSHYFIEKSLQRGLPEDRLLGQAYAGVTPRHCVVTEAGEPLAGCIS
ncbi:MAG: glycoside hydrolase family 2 protein, partial [Armatimonadota bacterium]